MYVRVCAHVRMCTHVCVHAHVYICAVYAHGNVCAAFLSVVVFHLPKELSLQHNLDILFYIITSYITNVLILK